MSAFSYLENAQCPAARGCCEYTCYHESVINWCLWLGLSNLSLENSVFICSICNRPCGSTAMRPSRQTTFRTVSSPCCTLLSTSLITVWLDCDHLDRSVPGFCSNTPQCKQHIYVRFTVEQWKGIVLCCCAQTEESSLLEKNRRERQHLSNMWWSDWTTFSVVNLQWVDGLVEMVDDWPQYIFKWYLNG